MAQILLLMLLALVAAYWMDSVRTREIAKRACDIACSQHDVQLLDNTVVRLKTRLRFSSATIFEFIRTYAFEFSSDGEKRHCGLIIMHGKRVSDIQLQPEIFPYNL